MRAPRGGGVRCFCVDWFVVITTCCVVVAALQHDLDHLVQDLAGLDKARGRAAQLGHPIAICYERANGCTLTCEKCKATLKVAAAPPKKGRKLELRLDVASQPKLTEQEVVRKLAGVIRQLPLESAESAAGGHLVVTVTVQVGGLVGGVALLSAPPPAGPAGGLLTPAKSGGLTGQEGFGPFSVTIDEGEGEESGEGGEEVPAPAQKPKPRQAKRAAADFGSVPPP